MHFPAFFFEAIIAIFVAIGAIIGWFSKWPTYKIGLGVAVGLFVIGFVWSQATSFEPWKFYPGNLPYLLAAVTLFAGLPVFIGSVIGRYLRKRNSS